jgi:hypothetical protein
MMKNIFCPNCASALKVSETVCKCGYEVSSETKKELSTKLNNIHGINFTDNTLLSNIHAGFEKINDFNLEKTYYRSSTAISDFESKTNILNVDIIKPINEFKKDVIEKGEKAAYTKVEVCNKILDITNFVLKDFFGPLTVKDNGVKEFISFKQFSETAMTKTISTYKLNPSKLKVSSIGEIGNRIGGSVVNTFESKSFQAIMKKDSLTKHDYKQMKTEVGVAIAAEAISAITDALTENSEAIKQVRKADNKLIKNIEKLSTTTNSLKIDEKEIFKKQKFYDIANLTLDTCFNTILKPIMKDVYKDTTFIQYIKEREFFHIQKEFVDFNKELSNISVKIPFWDILFKNKNKIFRKAWVQKIDQSSFRDRYLSLQKYLEPDMFNSIDNVNTYEHNYIMSFKEFEKTKRRELNQLNPIKNNKPEVVKFLAVLKQVKLNLN